MVSKGRQRERERASARRVEQGPVVYVEEGAKGELFATARRAFGVLFRQLNLPMMPRVVACGGRQTTYDKFVEHVARRSGDAVLLVDSEEVRRVDRWAHVKQRAGDKWTRPAGAKDDDLFFMAVVMETWCLAQLYESKKPLEQIEKSDVYDLLSRATKGQWNSRMKAASFEWLEKVAAQRLRERCPEFDQLARRLGA
jgi:hypothetical protein